ncbi:MAG: uroporphyrinogen-III synthase [Micrococcaceae bacterium]
MKLVIPDSRYATFASNMNCEPLEIPVLKIQSVQPADIKPHFAQAFDWLIVTSQNTVRALKPLKLQQQFKVAAVGKKTAAACEEMGWNVAFIPKEESTAGLVAQNLVQHQIQGTVCLPQSSLSSEALENELTHQGCTVDAFTAYVVEIVKDKGCKEQLQQQLVAENIKGFYCTSPSVAQGYLWLAEGYHRAVEFYAIGKTTQRYLDEHRE